MRDINHIDLQGGPRAADAEGPVLNLARLDMNLVVALRALLEERGVTRAAGRVGVSQPAMSASLSRLRRHFGDELLVRSGNAYGLTPLGAALLAPVAAACGMLERVFTAQPSFDPAAATREFTLLGTDYSVTVFGTALSRALHRLAPGVRLTFRQATTAIGDDPAAVLSSVDGLVLPHGIIDGLPCTELFRDRWVCLVAEEHPEIGDELSIEDLARLPWAVYQRPYDAPAARQLSMIGVSPRVEISTPFFSSLPQLIEGTDRVCLIQQRLVDKLGCTAAVRVLPAPFDAVPVQEALWWHPAHERDPGHAWLRECAAATGRAMAAG
ncbi:LysR family transcriptional regulator [Actinospica durhamensis]|uniref:LysR family transcriptional regulator n=1 Tax=Actinospica durhamensis TaxID=1508375 RepID=A0A941END3_9ACTN|nr:LysR family transcriptional regulator [Actinospica durhamensis]MBR7835595.1 LysR family transcriptional regulator [Actinospica durhamensis]